MILAKCYLVGSLLTLSHTFLAFHSSYLTQVNKCLSIKGAEDSINKPNSFEISTMDSSQFFIADSDKVTGCAVE